MAFKNQEIAESLDRLTLLEEVLSLSIVKDESSNTSEIESVLSNAKHHLNELGANGQFNQNETVDQYAKRLTESIKKKTQRQSEEIAFKFSVLTVSPEILLDELQLSDFTLDQVSLTIGHKTIVFVSRMWHELENSELKQQHIKNKYVKNTDKTTEKISYSIASQYSISYSNEVKRCVSYLDKSLNIIDWTATVSCLQDIASSNGYSTANIKTALLCFIRSANLKETLFADLNIDQIANALMKSVRPLDKMQLLWQGLRSLVRPQGTPLVAVMAQVDSYLHKIYPKVNQFKQRSNHSLIGLTSFINDEISLEISKDVKRKRELNQDVNLDYYIRLVQKLENDTNLMPKIDLTYGRRNANNGITESLVMATKLNNTKVNQVNKHKNMIQKEISNSDSESEDDYNMDIMRRNILSQTKFSKQEEDYERHNLFQTITDDKNVTLGQCFSDRSEGKPRFYIYFKKSYYTGTLDQMSVPLQIEIINCINTGRINEVIKLCIDNDTEQIDSISKTTYDNAKLKGVKLNPAWSEFRLITLRDLANHDVERKMANLTLDSIDTSQDSEILNSVNQAEFNNMESKENAEKIKFRYNNKKQYNNNARDHNTSQYFPNSQNGQNRYKNNESQARARSLSSSRFQNEKSHQPKENKRLEYQNPYSRDNSRENHIYQNKERYDRGNLSSKDQRPYEQERDTSAKRNQRSYRQTDFSEDRDERKYRSGLVRNNRYIPESRTSERKTRRDAWDKNRDRYRSRSDSYNGYRNVSPSNYGKSRDKYSNDRENSRDRSKYRTNYDNRSYSRERNDSNDRHSDRRRSDRNGYDKKNYDNQKSNTRDSRNRTIDDVKRQREKSMEINFAYPDMRRGINCDSNYDPLMEKICKKCDINGKPHHAFLCKKFDRFSKVICTTCRLGLHLESECKLQKSEGSNKLNTMSESTGKDKISEILQILSTPEN